MISALQEHARQIAADAAQLAGLLSAGAEVPPLVMACALVDLEDVRARLARVSETITPHIRHERPAATK